MLLLAWLGACIVVHDCPDCRPTFTCTDVAIRNGSGQPDPCDVAACQSCVDTCGSDCAILESYPPQYTCSTDSWDVYDTCPDWTFDQPRATDIANLGCGETGGESFVATATVTGHIDVTHRDALVGCCPDSIDVAVSTTSAVLAVDYTTVGDDCDCACLLDVAYTLVDVPSGSWTLVASPSGATTTVTVP